MHTVQRAAFVASNSTSASRTTIGPFVTMLTGVFAAASSTMAARVSL